MLFFALIAIIQLIAVQCDFCIQSASYYFVSGSYIESAYMPDSTIYRMMHPCGDKYLFYNALFKKLMITDEEYVQTSSGAITFNAACNNQGVTDPTQCTSWSGVSDLVVSSGTCPGLCGTAGRCIPQSSITVTGSFYSPQCAGSFTKLDYMDIYKSATGYYWFNNGNGWKCSAQLPVCDGTSYSIYGALSDAEMATANTCTTPASQSCVL